MAKTKSARSVKPKKAKRKPTQKVLSDMSFDEALRRIARVNPKKDK